MTKMRWTAMAVGLFVLAALLLPAAEIHDAVRAGDLAKVQALLEKDPGLANALDQRGMPPLLVACLDFKSLDIVRCLVEHGADVNLSGKYSGTLLDMIYEFGNSTSIPYLESRGARYSPIDLRLEPVRGAVSRITYAWGMLNNIAVSAGPDGILMVDSGFSKRATGELNKKLEGLHRGELRIIVNSHSHGDHIAGNILAGPGVRMIDAASLRRPETGSEIFPAPPLKGPKGGAFEGVRVLRFNGEDVVFVPNPGLHSEADILTYFRGSGVVHMGDLLLSQSCPAVSDVLGYMVFLDKVIDVFPEGTIFISGHGRDLTMTGLKRYKADLAAMNDIVKKNYDQGKTVEDMLRADVLQAFKADYSQLDWLGPDSWLPRVYQSLKPGRTGNLNGSGVANVAGAEATERLKASAEDTKPLPYDPQKTFSIDALKEDLQTLWNVLDEGHGGFDRYTARDELKRLFDEAGDGITSPLTEVDFYLRVLPLIAAVKDGHSRSGLSPEADAFLKSQAVYFPFGLRFLNDKVYIFRNLSVDSTIKEGAELLAINGMPMEDVLSRLMALMPSDAGIRTRKLRQLEFPENFGRLLALRFGRPATYLLRLGDPLGGEPREVTVPGIKGSDVVTVLHQRYPKSALEPPLYELKFRGETAVLTIRAFADEETKGRPTYPDFLKNVFIQLAEKKTRSLVIDLRDNGGGADEYGKLLFAYAADKPFLYYKALETKKDHYDLFKYTKISKADEEGLARQVKKNARGWYDVIGHPNLGPQQPRDPHFGGRVAVLINGLSFSATGESTSLFHYHHKAVFFGEECGAGYYGNTSGFSLMVTLPRTGLQIRVPLVLYTMAVDGYPQDRGIIPEVPVAPMIQDLLAGRDPVMDRALKFLNADETADDLTPAQAQALIEAHDKDPHFVILDVRTPEEFAQGHLKNALNIDLRAADFAEKLGQLSTSDTYLVYCRGGVRSLRAMGLMKAEGFSRVNNLAGGYLRWQEENRPVSK